MLSKVRKRRILNTVDVFCICHVTRNRMQKWESDRGEKLKRNKRIVDIFNILPNSVGYNNNNCFKSARQEVAFSHLKISIVTRNQIYQQKQLLHCGLETSIVLRQIKFPACTEGLIYITLKLNLWELIGKTSMFWAVCRWHGLKETMKT